MAKCRTFFFDGHGVSAGVVIGPAHVLESQGFEVDAHNLAPEDVEQEIARFHEAIEKARQEVIGLARAVTEKLDAQQAAIFDAHVTLLGDPLLIDRTIERIRNDHRNCEYVFWAVTKDIGDQLSSLGDDYFSERTHDLFDVARRVIKFLRLIKNPEGYLIPEGAIVVANDLGPSETAQFRQDRIAGFCTNSGGANSHTAIMAKALGIPAVVGLDFVTHYVRNGDFLIVDGTKGTVILNPTNEQIAHYRALSDSYEQDKISLSQISSLPPDTLDGITIALEANIEFSNEVPLALRQGATGVGLYRTEYLYIERDTLPTEAEQEESYRAVLDAMGDLPVVIRTLDVGGDKLSQTIPTPHENNPFLGLRALRLCLAFPELFRSQLRPMLKAAAGKTIRILLPMVSGVEEIQLARSIIDDVVSDLRRLNHQVPTEILVGAMIEIPSAALQAHALAEEVDFFSIGTNDLTQYTLAVDRVNKMVGNLYHETHPAVLHLIEHVVRASEETNTPLAVCGEMAGNPDLALLLIGMGVRTLSMSPSLIGSVRKEIRRNELSALQEMAREALKCRTPQEVRDHIKRTLARHAESRSERGIPTN